MPLGVPKDTCPINTLMKVEEMVASCEITV